jgi:hypothetical protein
MKTMIAMKFFHVSALFADKRPFGMRETGRTKRQSCVLVTLQRLFERQNAKQKVEYQEFAHHFTLAKTIMETKMTELGPHTMILQSESGDTHEISVSAFIGDATEFAFEDGDTVEEFHGHIVVKFEEFERRIEASAMNSLELAGRLMMLAEAYISRTCDVEKLIVYKTVPDDVKSPTDMFR